ncbi:MAG: uroporphyrinogen decarboxylase [Bdellovibrionaceae bacterium]|nr:uroporphyrinogen decarboxylase [Bdellovibrionales bacterium]MCB9254393.1 uroporphyrinogen decarboxylase [Pseudobdellovibrionaceae bacterium]
MKPDIIRHLEGESLGRFPVWMMRQAGRYLQSYRDIRKENTFWEMVSRPEVAAKVSLLPLEVLDVDAVIFFSDILTLPYGLGVPVELHEGVGPVLPTPLRSRADFDVFQSFDPAKHTGFVGEALTSIREGLHPSKALFGFAGAPWTVASYLIEGRSSREFRHLLGWMQKDPNGLAEVLRTLANATSAYLEYQIRSGAHAVQLFDTWASVLPLGFYEEYYLPIINGIFEKLAPLNVPRIYYFKQAAHLAPVVSKLKADILSVDANLTLPQWETLLGSGFSLQGNLDPTTLLQDEGTVRLKTRELVQQARTLSKPAILNLGHGILKDVPVANAKAFVDEARTLWI